MGTLTKALPVLLLCCSLRAQQLVIDFDRVPQGSLTQSMWTNCFVASPDFTNAAFGGFFTNIFSVVPVPWTAESYSWTAGGATVTNGGQCLAADLTLHSDCYVAWRKAAKVPLLTVGFVFSTDGTNAGLAAMPVETMLACELAYATQTPLLTFKTNAQFWQIHGGKSPDIKYGPPIPTTLADYPVWVTMRLTLSNATMAVYSLATHQQIGTNSSYVETNQLAGFEYFRLQAWDSAPTMPTKFMYYDSVVLNTNDVFPMLPWTEDPLELAAIQAQVDAASDGDTITLTAGGIVWETPLLISNKAITLQGSASGTWITNNNEGETGSDTSLSYLRSIRIYGTSNGVTRVSRLNFDGPTHPNFVYADGDKWSAIRVDNCNFYNSGHAAVDFNGMVAGLVDHCYFQDGLSTVCSYASPVKNYSWTNDLTLGSTNAVVVETNSVLYTDAYTNSTIGTCSQGLGGRVVWRHNYITNTTSKWWRFLDAHGNQKPVDTTIQPTILGITNSHRGTRQIEIYENVVNAAGGGALRLTDWRGGTLVCFSNTFLGSGASGTFHAREEDGYYFEYLTEYPGYDQHWGWLWDNTSKGSAITALDFEDDLDATFLVDDLNVFWAAKDGYTPLAYPHPLRGETPPPSPPPQSRVNKAHFEVMRIR